MTDQRLAGLSILSEEEGSAQLPNILQQVSEGNERFLIERGGEPSILVLSVKDYFASTAPIPDWLRAIGEDAKRNALDRLTAEQVDEIIAEVRNTYAVDR